MKTTNVRWRVLLVSLLLPIVLAACSTPLQPSTSVMCPKPQQSPELPESLKVPPQRESYLEAAQQRIQDWQQKLIASETK